MELWESSPCKLCITERTQFLLNTPILISRETLKDKAEILNEQMKRLLWYLNNNLTIKCSKTCKQHTTSYYGFLFFVALQTVECFGYVRNKRESSDLFVAATD